MDSAKGRLSHGRGFVSAVAVGTILMSLARVIAQQPPAPSDAPPSDDCIRFPAFAPRQTIIVKLDNADCVVDRISGGIPQLRTHLDSNADWDVCNLCKQPVDVRLSSSGLARYSLNQLFQNFRPPLDSDGSTYPRIPEGQRPIFKGRASDDGAYAGWPPSKYVISVKFSEPPNSKWDVFDPELQLDENPLLLVKRRTTALIGLTSAALGIAVGFLLGRRGKRV